MTFGTKKTRMAWLPDGEKIEDMFVHFDRMHERFRQSDGRMDGSIDGRTPHDGIGRACIASRGKSYYKTSVGKPG